MKIANYVSNRDILIFDYFASVTHDKIFLNAKSKSCLIRMNKMYFLLLFFWNCLYFPVFYPFMCLFITCNEQNYFVLFYYLLTIGLAQIPQKNMISSYRILIVVEVKTHNSLSNFKLLLHYRQHISEFIQSKWYIP